LELKQIVGELTRERDRLNRAIEALGEFEATTPVVQRKVATSKPANSNGKQGHSLTPAGRQRLSESMKKRLAERRKGA
jgi:Spy/CpxP family protein refolding chaperone